MINCLTFRHLLALCCLLLTVPCLVVFAGNASAAIPVENPQDGSIGVEGRIPSGPPSVGATITTPRNGQTFTDIPIAVNGICPKGLLVKIFSNNVFVGSVQCETGSYTIQIDLLSGRNDLVARAFDSLDQSSPDSGVVTVTFNDSQFNPFGTTQFTITSNFAQRGANPGQRLVWPIILNGGTGPYAVSADWGDGKPSSLISSEFTGDIDLNHVYDKAGTYKVIIRGTDKNGLSAFLQLVAVANGAVTSKPGAQDGSSTIITKVLWLPALICMPLLMASFWLGRRYELAVLRKQLERREQE